MRKKRLWVLALAFSMCIILSTPFMASAQDYPTADGEPLFTLHIVTVENNWVTALRSKYVAEALHDIGIECVIHPVPWSAIVRGIYNPEDYGFQKPGPSGPPEIVELPGVPNFHHDPIGEVMWCGANNLYWATPPGYGNNWDDRLTKEFDLPAGASLTYSIQYDTELWYDYVSVEISTDEIQWNEITFHTGISIGFEEPSIDLSNYVGDVFIRFRFISDIGWSDEDGGYDSNGACRIDWVKVTGSSKDEFTTGTDGWVASHALPVVQGWDMVVGPAFHSDIGGYDVDCLASGTTGDGHNFGYLNPKYDALYNELESLGIDWNANFPDPPDLEEQGRPLKLLKKLQKTWIKDQPLTILWCRHDLPGGYAAFPYILYNFNNEHLAKREVRRAISLSIPRQEMMEATQGGPLDKIVVQTPLPPWHPGFSNKFDPEYKPQKAMELLRDAGYSYNGVASDDTMMIAVINRPSKSKSY